MRLFLFIFFVFNFCQLEAQRNKSLSTLSKEELAQKKYDDSVQRMKEEFETNFNIQSYFKKLKEIRLKNDTIQLNETLSFIESIEPKADTITQLTIQASALSVFPNSIRNFKNLRVLTLRRCQSVYLEDLFEKLKDIPHLEELNILFSEKAKLPENISLLKHLKVLNLNGNKLNELPNGLAQLPALEKINLHNNINLNDASTFEVLSKVRTLKEVDMSGCRFYSLSNNMVKMSQISRLDLSMNGLESIPDNLESMVGLKHIDLSGNKKLMTITAFSNLSKIPNLERIDFEDAEQTEIPGSIGTITQLKVLNLKNNPIGKVHPSIGNLTKLEELYLGIEGNTKDRVNLKSIPSEISKCTQLRKLDLKLCQIEEIPNSLSNLKQLQYVDLSWNQLKAFPSFLKSLSQLEYLDVSRNKINEFPTDLGVMGTSLHTLLFEGNFYSPYAEKIHSIPLSILRLKNLKHLSFKDQVFESLPDNFWSELNKMETLNLMGALLPSIPDNVEKMTELRSLNLKANEIKSISPQLAQLKKLEYLNLSYNPDIQSTALVEIVKAMPQLKTLDISYNDIKKEIIQPLKETIPQLNIIKFELKDSPEYEKPKK